MKRKLAKQLAISPVKGGSTSPKTMFLLVVDAKYLAAKPYLFSNALRTTHST
jgi:hypothetical protein